jgi:hypothetical protein
MSRKENFQKRVMKRKKAGAFSEKDLDALLESYRSGQLQRFKGEIKAAAVEQFLSNRSEKIRSSYEDIVKSLYELRGTNFKRFRTIVLFNILVAYQNGSVDGSDNGKSFDLLRLMEEAAGKIIDENLET